MSQGFAKSEDAVNDHGQLDGLADDDHTQYLNVARHDADDHSGLTVDHGTTTGLTDDDHTQYLLVDGSREMSGQLVVPEGGAGTPGLSFAGDSNTGFFHSASDRINIALGGSEAAEFQTGICLIPAIYSDTFGSGANVHVSSNGRLRRATSSLQYKEGWASADEVALAALELPTPIVWEDEEAGVMLGFGAEHVGAMLPAAAQDYNEDDEPENYDVRSLVAILSAKVKRLEEQNESLEARLDALETKS